MQFFELLEYGCMGVLGGGGLGLKQDGQDRRRRRKGPASAMRDASANNKPRCT